MNCSKDISRVIEYIDGVGKSGSRKKIQRLKDSFGLGDLEYFDDFARYCHSKLQETKSSRANTYEVRSRMGRGFGNQIPFIQATRDSINFVTTSK